VPRRLPPLNSLAAFEAAARLGSFTKAAGELYVTPAAISRHIALLEAWIGRPLFERRSRGVQLTPAGETYRRECTDVFDRIAQATARQVAGGRQRLRRVSALATFAMRWLIPRLASFQSEHPDIEVRLTTSSEPLASLRGEFDAVIRGPSEVARGYAATEFLREHRVPVCSPSLVTRRALRKPADLAKHTLLHSAALPEVWPEWLRAAGVADLVPRGSLTLEHFYLTLQAAVDGLGVAIGPVALVADDVAEGRLVKPFNGPTLTEWRYVVYVREGRDDDAARQFKEWLVRAAARHIIAVGEQPAARRSEAGHLVAEGGEPERYFPGGVPPPSDRSAVARAAVGLVHRT
jgi:LysR family glycine cleavage system transcriptional activator